MTLSEIVQNQKILSSKQLPSLSLIALQKQQLFDQFNQATPTIINDLKELIHQPFCDIQIKTLITVVEKLYEDKLKAPINGIESYYRQIVLELIPLLIQLLREKDFSFWKNSMSLLQLRETLAVMFQIPCSVVRIEMTFHWEYPQYHNNSYNLKDPGNFSLSFSSAKFFDFSYRKMKSYYNQNNQKVFLLTIQECLILINAGKWNGGGYPSSILGSVQYTAEFDVLKNQFPFFVSNILQPRKYCVGRYNDLQVQLKHQGIERDHIPCKQLLSKFSFTADSIASKWAIAIEASQHTLHSFSYGQKYSDNKYQQYVDHNNVMFYHPIQAAQIDIMHFLANCLPNISSKDEKLEIIGAYILLFSCNCVEYRQFLYGWINSNIFDVFHNFIGGELLKVLES